MKLIKTIPITKGVHGEYKLPDGEIITGSSGRGGGIRSYPLGKKNIFTAKYNSLYKSIKETSTGRNVGHIKIEFTSTEQAVYQLEAIVTGGSHGWKGLDKMEFVDKATGAYYVAEMCALDGMLELLAKGVATVKMDGEDTILKAPVYFEYRGGTQFMEFFTKEKEDAMNELDKKNKQIFLTPAKLQPWHSYTKKNADMSENTYIVAPIFYGDHTRYHTGTTRDKPLEELVKKGMLLSDYRRYGLYTGSFTGHFYNEKALIKDTFLKELSDKNKATILDNDKLEEGSGRGCKKLITELSLYRNLDGTPILF